MTKPSDMAMSFEAVLLGAVKDKNGFVIKLAIHPNDIPEELMRDLVGTRYQIAAVRLKDDGQPAGKKKERRRDEIQHAALLCLNPNFQKFMEERHGAFALSSEEATQTLKIYLGIASRKELAENERARRLFHELVREYETWGDE